MARQPASIRSARDSDAVAHILGDSGVTLWSLSSRRRLGRQLRALGVTEVGSLSGLRPDAAVLLLRADYLFEERTLRVLLSRSRTVLVCPRDEGRAAAIADGRDAESVAAALANAARPMCEGYDRITPADSVAFDTRLRRSAVPLLEPITAERQRPLENLLYGNAYKGITDLVTKWLWPRPAKRLVRACARLGLTPNAVTTTGFLLVLLACALFFNAWYWGGLLAGWVMTLLDTVDGKLARVTVQSSRLGHAFDHGIDLVHPPFWYLCWGASLSPVAPLAGLSVHDLGSAIVAGYVVGRLVEILFHQLGDCSIFAWRPFDAWFRLVTARRNPCLILMSAAMLARRPDWGFVGVAAWTVGTTLVLLLRLCVALAARLRGGSRLQPWLADPASAALHPLSHRVFSTTAAAYATD